MSEQSVTCQDSDTRKKRDWKAINAKRVPAEMRDRGVSRHQWQQIKRATFLSTYSKNGLAIERVKNGETLPQVLRDLDDEHYPDRNKWPETDRKIQKLWKCLLKAVHAYGEDWCKKNDRGAATDEDSIRFAFLCLMDREECQNPDTLNMIIREATKKRDELRQNPDTQTGGSARLATTNHRRSNRRHICSGNRRHGARSTRSASEVSSSRRS